MDLLGPPPGLAALHAAIEKDYLRKIGFRRLLKATLPSSTGPTLDPFVVVNLGCRMGEDTSDIAAHFNEAKQPYRHIGIDCDSRAIEYAIKTYPDPHTTYIDDNAADPEVVKYYPPQVDLVLLRHPEILRGNEDIWHDMILYAWSRANQDSQILITTYNKPEYLLVHETFSTIPNTTLTFSGINPQRDPELVQWSNRTNTWNCPDHYRVNIKRKAQ